MVERFVRSPEGMELAILCIDMGYKLADRVQDLTRDQIDFLMAALEYRLELMREALTGEEGMKIIITGD